MSEVDGLLIRVSFVENIVENMVDRILAVALFEEGRAI